jgi:hypothetical protein
LSKQNEDGKKYVMLKVARFALGPQHVTVNARRTREAKRFPAYRTTAVMKALEMTFIRLFVMDVSFRA